MKVTKVFILLVIAATLMACSFTVNLPSVQTGVTQTFTIDEPKGTESEPSVVNIEMGAGKLQVSGGTDKFIEGEIIYNVDLLKPVVTRVGNSITLSQKSASNIRITEGSIKNNWNIKLGSMPMELSLATGAYEGDLDLSGLSITQLTVSDGASKSHIRFDTPNPVEMSLLRYKTGASDITLSGLGNANVSDVTFEGGVGHYQLDFTGELTRDMNVSIKSGVSDVELVFPADRHVKVTLTGGLKNVIMGGTWSVTNNVYEFGSSGPTIYVTVDMAVGNLQLTQQ